MKRIVIYKLDSPEKEKLAEIILNFLAQKSSDDFQDTLDDLASLFEYIENLLLTATNIELEMMKGELP